MVVNHLYYNDAQPAGTPSQSFSFSPKLLQQALQNIYGPSFDPEKDIEPTFWQTFTKAFNQAADQGFSQSSYNPSQAFTSALRHSNAVFAAFKTHRLQNDLAQLLTDSNGNLKPFQQWKKDILPIASHQCQHWLQTEYDTAVLRAHQAADWQQFQAEKDVLPNLRWMPSTSPNPGADHLPFWNTVLPVDHPFWDQHRPGDRWNCKCSLSATDDPATSVPTAPASSAGGNRPHPGLDTNPGKTAQLFSNTQSKKQSAKRKKTKGIGPKSVISSSLAVSLSYQGGISIWSIIISIVGNYASRLKSSGISSRTRTRKSKRMLQNIYGITRSSCIPL